MQLIKAKRGMRSDAQGFAIYEMMGNEGGEYRM